MFGAGGGVAEEEGGGEWGWSPASALASPAVLNAFLSSQVPAELVGRAKASVSRDVLAGKIVGKKGSVYFVCVFFITFWCCSSERRFFK